MSRAPETLRSLIHWWESDGFVGKEETRSELLEEGEEEQDAAAQSSFLYRAILFRR